MLYEVITIALLARQVVGVHPIVLGALTAVLMAKRTTRQSGPNGTENATGMSLATAPAVQKDMATPAIPPTKERRRLSLSIARISRVV